MTFPNSKRVVFGRNPIAQVICQLKFPPILEILTAPPAEFQKDIRGDYPLYVREDNAGLPREIAEFMAKLPGSGQIAESVVHKFATEDGTRNVALGKDFVSVTATRYERWQRFEAHVSDAIKPLETIYRPAFYTRLGLRYVNAIDRTALGLGNRDWKDLLNAAFVGVLASEQVAGNVVNFQAQTVIDLKDNVPGAFVAMRIGLKSDSPGRSVFIIDNDFFMEGKTESHDVIKILDEFNHLDGNLFRWAIGVGGPLWNSLLPTDLAD
jgi:uncharacterized protein (TIGR04255 family)